MNILTLCQRGDNRSVILAHLLRRRGERDVISIGAYTTSQETLHMLYDWADIIYPVEESLVGVIPPEYSSKVKLINIGPDVWGFKPNPVLYNRVKSLI